MKQDQFAGAIAHPNDYNCPTHSSTGDADTVEQKQLTVSTGAAPVNPRPPQKINSPIRVGLTLTLKIDFRA